MSFEQIKNTDEHIVHPRSCVLLNSFNPAEMKQLKNLARLTGISEQIFINGSYNDTTLMDLLENPALTPTTSEDTSTLKAVVFNNVSANRMNAFIEGLKKCRINRPLIAVVTDTSINWTLSELINNLSAEREAFKNNQGDIH